MTAPFSRRSLLAGAGLALLAAPAYASRTPLPAMPKLGTSRMLAVNTTGGPCFGRKEYAATLPLADGEVVLTFDDGPLPATTPHVLDALAAEDVRATFFLIGRNAAAAPAIVRRIAAAGHSIGNHTQSHPWTLRNMSFAAGLADIDKGAASITAALGTAGHLAPFIRFPGFADTSDLLAEMRRRNVAVFGADLWASDWNLMTPAQELKLVMGRLRRARKGILLLHDARHQTAAMVPQFLRALKVEGFKVVQAVPA